MSNFTSFIFLPNNIFIICHHNIITPHNRPLLLIQNIDTIIVIWAKVYNIFYLYKRILTSDRRIGFCNLFQKRTQCLITGWQDFEVRSWILNNKRCRRLLYNCYIYLTLRKWHDILLHIIKRITYIGNISKSTSTWETSCWAWRSVSRWLSLRRWKIRKIHI